MLSSIPKTGRFETQVAIFQLESNGGKTLMFQLKAVRQKEFLARAALTKYQRLGSLKNKKHFLTVLEA